MLSRNSWRLVGRLSLIGFLIPCLLFAVFSATDMEVGRGSSWLVLVVWPSFPFIMSAEAGGSTTGALLALLISALVNAVIYGAIGALIGILVRRRSKD